MAGTSAVNPESVALALQAEKQRFAMKADADARKQQADEFKFLSDIKTKELEQKAFQDQADLEERRAYRAQQAQLQTQAETATASEHEKYQKFLTEQEKLSSANRIAEESASIRERSAAEMAAIERNAALGLETQTKFLNLQREYALQDQFDMNELIRIGEEASAEQDQHMAETAGVLVSLQNKQQALWQTIPKIIEDTVTNISSQDLHEKWIEDISKATLGDMEEALTTSLSGLYTGVAPSKQKGRQPLDLAGRPVGVGDYYDAIIQRDGLDPNTVSADAYEEAFAAYHSHEAGMVFGKVSALDEAAVKVANERSLGKETANAAWRVGGRAEARKQATWLGGSDVEIEGLKDEMALRNALAASYSAFRQSVTKMGMPIEDVRKVLAGIEDMLPELVKMATTGQFQPTEKINQLMSDQSAAFLVSKFLEVTPQMWDNAAGTQRYNMDMSSEERLAAQELDKVSKLVRKAAAATKFFPNATRTAEDTRKFFKKTMTEIFGNGQFTSADMRAVASKFKDRPEVWKVVGPIFKDAERDLFGLEGDIEEYKQLYNTLKGRDTRGVRTSRAASQMYARRLAEQRARNQ
jgi:hypothetical protein